jgi:hypothetical protein
MQLKKKSVTPESEVRAGLAASGRNAFLPQTRVWGFAAPPSSGQIGSASTSAAVRNHDAWLQNASASLAAAGDSEDETPDLSQCDRIGMPSIGKTGQVGHNHLKKRQNAISAAIAIV